MYMLGIEPPIDDPRAYAPEPPEPWWADPVQLAAADRKTLNEVVAIKPYGLAIKQPHYLNPDDIAALGQKWSVLPLLASLHNAYAITAQADGIVILYCGVHDADDFARRVREYEYITQVWLDVNDREACILYPVVEARGETLAYDERLVNIKFSDAIKIFERAGYDFADFA